MNDVERRAREGGAGDHFLEARHAAADVDVYRGVVAARYADHLQHFPLSRRRGVRGSEAHGHRAFAQPFVYQPGHLCNLGRACDLVRGVATWQERARIMHHRDADGNMPDADTVVNRPSGLPFAIPAVDIPGADLELERRGHAVLHLAAIGFVRLPVRVEVDEARGNDQSGRVELLPARQRSFGDRRNLSVLDANASHRIQSRFRIDDAPSDDEIEVLRRQRNDDAEGETEQENSDEDFSHE